VAFGVLHLLMTLKSHERHLRYSAVDGYDDMVKTTDRVRDKGQGFDVCLIWRA